MNNGILYINQGIKCIPRLIVSIYSLKKHYNGNICIVSIGEESNLWCLKIAKHFGIYAFCIDKTNITGSSGDIYFEKARMNLFTPFDNTLIIDSDTLIIKDPSDIFPIIAENEFVLTQFSDWRTNGRTISHRIRQWSSICPDKVEDVISSNLPSINCGVVGFAKKNEFMEHWFDFTLKNPTAHLREETSAHVLLKSYKNKIVDSRYNCSCKYDNPRKDDVRIVHYHGRKHCRMKDGKLLYNADMWVEVFEEVRKQNICGIMEVIPNAGDRYLRGLLKGKI